MSLTTHTSPLKPAPPPRQSGGLAGSARDITGPGEAATAVAGLVRGCSEDIGDRVARAAIQDIMIGDLVVVTRRGTGPTASPLLPFPARPLVPAPGRAVPSGCNVPGQAWLPSTVSLSRQCRERPGLSL